MKISIREDLIISADRSRATVIWGMDKYAKGANSHLNKEKFYHELSTNPHENHQNLLINSLNDMFRKNLIPKEP